MYNRIAGPFNPLRGIGTYLQFDGVIIARINTDIRLADFEAGVRNFVSDVENAYWELYFAYRNLEAAKIGRDSASANLAEGHALFVGEARGGEADKEAQAREQYFFFRGQLETRLDRPVPRREPAALHDGPGRHRWPPDPPHATSRPTPASASTGAKSTPKACAARVELRQQKWRIKQRELELIASKNLLLPRLDAVGTLSLARLGRRLDRLPRQSVNRPSAPVRSYGTDAFSHAWPAATSRNGSSACRFSMPIGFRQPLAAVRNAQLQLARERSVLQDRNSKSRTSWPTRSATSTPTTC